MKYSKLIQTLITLAINNTLEDNEKIKELIEENETKFDGYRESNIFEILIRIAIEVNNHKLIRILGKNTTIIQSLPHTFNICVLASMHINKIINKSSNRVDECIHLHNTIYSVFEYDEVLTSMLWSYGNCSFTLETLKLLLENVEKIKCRNSSIKDIPKYLTSRINKLS